MELRVLNYFLIVAREENITKAAQLLHMTQPTLSRQLMQLEEELGVKLFHRGKHNVTLTEDGRQRAEDVLERHTILADLLMHIGVSKETAMADACKIEHDLSEESFEAIKRALHSSKLLSDNRW